MNSVSSFRYSDYWIGLVRGSDLTCTCDNMDPGCDDCRESWQWDDDTPMMYRYQQWRDFGFIVDPGTQFCGRINTRGWADLHCDYKLKYICRSDLGK